MPKEFIKYRKAIKLYKDTAIAVGYCRLQFLLKNEQPFMYTATDSEGWKCDFYKIGDFIISTGYGPIGRNCNYALCKKYDELAMNHPELAREYLKQFIDELKLMKY